MSTVNDTAIQDVVVDKDKFDAILKRFTVMKPSPPPRRKKPAAEKAKPAK